MRGGRPAMRGHFRGLILTVLADNPYPVTATSVKQMLDERRPRRCGWDTVRKYLDELVEDRLVLRQQLPAEQGRKPLVLYMGRSRPKG